MIEAPFSEDQEYSSDYLDEYHGRDAYYDSDQDESNHSRMLDENFNLTPIDSRHPPRFEEFKTGDGFTDNDILFQTESSINNTNVQKEESKS
jgi:hypothetical protein